MRLFYPNPWVFSDLHGYWCADCFEYIEPSGTERNHHVVKSTPYRQIHSSDTRWSSLGHDWTVTVHDLQCHKRRCHLLMDDEAAAALRALENDLSEEDSAQLASYASKAHNEGLLRKAAMLSYHLWMREPCNETPLSRLLLSISGTTINALAVIPGRSPGLKRRADIHLIRSAPENPVAAFAYFDACTAIMANHADLRLGKKLLELAKDNCRQLSDAVQSAFRENELRREVMLCFPSADAQRARDIAEAYGNSYSVMTTYNYDARNNALRNPSASLAALDCFVPWHNGTTSWWQLATRLFTEACARFSEWCHRGYSSSAPVFIIARLLIKSNYILGMLGLRPTTNYDPTNKRVALPTLNWPGDLLNRILLEDEWRRLLERGKLEDMCKAELRPIRDRVLARIKHSYRDEAHASFQTQMRMWRP